MNNLFWLDIAGGEPFLRKDLYKIVNMFKINPQSWEIHFNDTFKELL